MQSASWRCGGSRFCWKWWTRTHTLSVDRCSLTRRKNTDANPERDRAEDKPGEVGYHGRRGEVHKIGCIFASDRGVVVTKVEHRRVSCCKGSLFLHLSIGYYRGRDSIPVTINDLHEVSNHTTAACGRNRATAQATLTFARKRFLAGKNDRRPGVSHEARTPSPRNGL